MSDWLKMEKHTPEKPEILAMSSLLSLDPEIVFTKCFKVWRWADSQTVDGNAPGVTAALLDSLVSVTGFGAAMVKVGWLDEVGASITFPNFGFHMGESAKKRALIQKRVQESRKRNALSVTEALPKALPDKRREEEIREEEMQNTNASSEVASQPSEPPVLIFPCVGKIKEWYLFPSKLVEYRETYPGIDVLAECRKALQWCRDNKKNQKTAQGMPKFLGGWLGRNQDRAPTQQKVVKAFVTPPADPRTPEQKAADLAADRKRVEADKAQAASAAELLAKLRGGIGQLPEENP